MKPSDLLKDVNEFWDQSITPKLIEYIKIPNKSPMFDKQWREHGYMDQAIHLISEWCKTHGPENMSINVVQHGERTPVILMDIPGDNDKTILLYGHLDKQPEMIGWDADLGPWKPVLRDDKLYGRGGADDGYAAFASLTAVKMLQKFKIPHARCVILIEACEESGSPDLPYYIDALKNEIGQPDLIICLDSGCGNYDQLWLTTSLRGLVGGTLKIQVLKQGIHSGVGSGIAPSCFRILRLLLNRLEDQNSGDVILKDLQVEIPKERLEQVNIAADVLKSVISKELPFLAGVQPDSTSTSELILRGTWKPALSIIGCDGIPPIENAGNVTLPSLSVKLSMRLAPTSDAAQAAQAMKKTLEANPPYNAHVEFDVKESGSGWNAPKEVPWLKETIDRVSKNYFGKPAVYMGEGGSIPFMGMLGKKFPQAQFVITGVLGPASNAHGPNEFLHLPTAKKITACIAEVIAEQYKN